MTRAPGKICAGGQGADPAGDVLDDPLGAELGRPDDVAEHDVVGSGRGGGDDLVVQRLVGDQRVVDLDVGIGLLKRRRHPGQVRRAVARLLLEEVVERDRAARCSMSRDRTVERRHEELELPQAARNSAAPAPAPVEMKRRRERPRSGS